MMDEIQRAELESRAREMRYHIVRMMGADKPHHFGGSLSSVELIVALYFYKMRYDPADPDPTELAPALAIARLGHRWLD